jgi:hypothetical protein
MYMVVWDDENLWQKAHLFYWLQNCPLLYRAYHAYRASAWPQPCDAETDVDSV